jgi:DNA polymerase-1
MTVFDIETAGASELFSYGPGFARLAGWTDNGHIHLTSDMDELARTLQHSARVCGHNILGFDLLVLAHYHGLDLNALVNSSAVLDTLLLARHLDPPMARESGVDATRKYDLDALGEKLGIGGKSGDLNALAKEFGGYDKIPLDDARYRDYLIRDVELSAKLIDVLMKQATKDDWDYINREHQVAGLAANITLNGFKVDEPLLARRLEHNAERKEHALARLAEEFGVPLTDAKGKPYASPLASKAGKEALEAAFRACGVTRWIKTAKTRQIDTSADALAWQANEHGSNKRFVTLCRLIVQVVTLRTVYQTVAGSMVNGRVHPRVSFKQATGRWSLTDPGMTVMGKRGGRWREREIFLPDDGEVVLAVDLDQVDMRALAGLSQDPAYMELFRSGGDPHSEIALALFGDAGMRETAKPIGHGWNYGRGLEAISDSEGIAPKLVVQFDRAMRERFPRLVEWQNEVREQAESGELMDNGWGRPMRADPRRAHTQGPALAGQGAARDIMMHGLLRLPDYIRPMLRVQVHDEIVFSVPKHQFEEVRQHVLDALTFEWRGVPITADASGPGESWGAVYDKTRQQQSASTAVILPSVAVPSHESADSRSSAADTGGPFVSAVMSYRDRGWNGTLLIPAGQKGPPPKGFTGWSGKMPDDDQIAAWSASSGGHNIAVRLPDGVLGLDVDCYGDKPGAASLAALEAELGPLPATWTSTSRDDGSGIRYFRVPPGSHWHSVAGPGIELIHYGHRFAVVSPSLHPEGRMYAWLGPDGARCDIPSPEDFPELPAAWVERLMADRTSTTSGTADRAEFADLLARLPGGEECPVITETADETISSLAKGSRHDVMRDGVLALLGYAVRGHRGGAHGLGRIKVAFTEATEGEDRTGEWNRAMLGAAAKVSDPDPARWQCCDDAPADDSVWQARSWLADLETFAKARMVSPWGMLGCVLAMVSTHVGPHVVLPAIIGGQASLNLFVGLVGSSGAGKDASISAARSYLASGTGVDEHKLGTGQGVASAFTEQTKDGPVQFSDAGLFIASEIDTLTAHAGMPGSNLLATLKDVYTGSALGERYANKEKRRPVRAHHYRACLVVGIQPEKSAVLFNDSDGGTPQRWLWLPVTDPDSPDELPEEPLAMQFHVPDALAAMGSAAGPVERKTPIVLDVCDTAVNTTRAIRRAQLRGENVGLDGHTNLTRLKVAALLALVDARTAVSDDDWHLAGRIMATSLEWRKVCHTAVARRHVQANLAKAREEVERERFIDKDRERQCAKRIVAILGKHVDDWTPAAQVRRQVASSLRESVDSALDALETAGRIESQTFTYNGQEGTRYRLKTM